MGLNIPGVNHGSSGAIDGHGAREPQHGWRRPWTGRGARRTTRPRPKRTGRKIFSWAVPLLLFVGGLPAILSPLHPIAVYGYLAHAYLPSPTRPVFATTEKELAEFLLSREQESRYQEDLRADMLDRTTGHFFAIVELADGTYHQEPIRTWNGFMPASSPRWLTRWLDRKELPFLSDEVALWLEGRTIVAMGHYHAFGGVPSPGDRAAQWISALPEIVVVNSLVPMVYVDGRVLHYGDETEVPSDVRRMLRVAEPSLLMPPTQFLPISGEIRAETASLLGYLQSRRQVDTSDPKAVVDGIDALRLESVSRLAEVFDQGIYPENYPDDLDREVYARHLDTLESWVARRNAVLKREQRPR